MRGSCLGPGFRVFGLHVNRPTSQCCSVSQYIGRKCISGLGGALCPVARGHKGTKQQEIAHSSCCYWRVFVVRPTNLLSQQVSNRVVHRRRLAKHFQNRVWADGADGTCQPQIVALPSVPRTDQKVQQNQGPGSHKPLSIATGEWPPGRLRRQNVCCDGSPIDIDRQVRRYHSKRLTDSPPVA